MVRRLLAAIVTVATTLVVLTGTLAGVGVWRRSQDGRWCERAVMGGVAGDQVVSDDLVDEQRSACAVQPSPATQRQRQRQRVMFGALWRKGGTTMAQCGFELARLQLLANDREARRAVLEPYGIDDRDFSDGDLLRQDRFITACLARSG